MRKTIFAFVFFVLSLSSRGQFMDPFNVDLSMDKDVVTIKVEVPPGHYLYAESFEVTDGKGNQQQAIHLPEPSPFMDPNSGHEKGVYDASFSAEFKWVPKPGGAGKVMVAYQGCNDEVCFLPQSKVLQLAEESVTGGAVAVAPSSGVIDWQADVASFDVTGNAVGYLGASDFISFLDQAETGLEVKKPNAFHLFLNDPVAFVRERGLIATLLFILIGGLALNLTPCVLPMIPVNLAVIGAGAQAGSKGRGFALGATYGAGMALAYGLLGVIVVLTGSRFGTIQANPWFNLAIALVFVVLALAMFDVIHIDFSRFQSRIGSGSGQQSGSFLLALSMGAVAALLAGACVAPVVIAVLLLSANIYEASNAAGLLLPFVLGFGMALPWPFAGAGLSFLPKPGKWMVYVKYGFGIGIILFALYYGHLSYQFFSAVDIEEMHEEGHVVVDGSTNAGLADTLRLAAEEGRPVFIDFWASSCKNCKKMDRTTFKDEMVKTRLKDYIFIKYIANELSGSPSTKAVMDYFEVQGLPTFIVLSPQEDPSESAK
ncbi:MAG: thioredoxin family protein [Pontiellaceae bacterium]|nr:thioredoxin family protein [Pontiellaceae bacterium]MBN2784982.1 thioredoxin family protein [Pontiellaceae bacterium]